MLNQEERDFLLRLARGAIEDSLRGKESNISDVPESLMEKGACFVTLFFDGKPKWSIGALKAHRELYQDVLHNALAAAFEDPRFPSVTKGDLDKIIIEVSVVFGVKELKYESEEELLSQIEERKQGVIVKKSGRVGTLLPMMWEKTPNKIDFLNNICLKMGFSANAWKDDVDISVYEVESFKEQK